MLKIDVKAQLNEVQQRNKMLQTHGCQCWEENIVYD